MVSGRFAPRELWMQLWWNAAGPSAHIAPPPWPPAGPDLRFAPVGSGPVVNLTSVAGPAITGDCSFQATFVVPNVEPGTYQVEWVYGLEVHATTLTDDDGFALLSSPLTFQVTG